MHFQVLDEDVGRDGNVGESSTKLAALMHADGVSEWFEIQFKGEPAGKVHLRSEWVPKHEKHGFKKFFENHIHE